MLPDGQAQTVCKAHVTNRVNRDHNNLFEGQYVKINVVVQSKIVWCKQVLGKELDAARPGVA